MSDSTIKGAVGDDADQVAQGSRNRQQAQTMRAGDTYVGAAGDFPLWKLIEMDGNIRALVIQMDDLPNRVGRLERLEVVVKPGPPPEVIVRPLSPDTVNLSVRMILVVVLVAFLIVVSMVAWLVYLQVANV